MPIRMHGRQYGNKETQSYVVPQVPKSLSSSLASFYFSETSCCSVLPKGFQMFKGGMGCLHLD